MEFFLCVQYTFTNYMFNIEKKVISPFEKSKLIID